MTSAPLALAVLVCAAVYLLTVYLLLLFAQRSRLTRSRESG
ncbi:hypothetical protein [Stenomitos frigidus]|nr:hypothetical protein [Stenomitos frigidus]